MRPALIACAVLLVALTGCTSTVAVPAPPSGGELDRLIAQELDLQWHYVGLTPDAPRPTVEQIRIVSMDEAEAVHRECMVAAGYDNYGIVETAIFRQASSAERLAVYTCAAQYPVLPSSYGLFSEAQLDYLYDFYVTVTVPCIEATGIAVEGMPDRAEFVQSKDGVFALWNPYRGLSALKQGTYLASSKCSHVPDGFNLF